METSSFSLSLPILILTNIFTLSSSTPIFNLTTDENALLAFKNSLTDSNGGVLTNNWSAATSICRWTGVSCGPKHSRVTALNVSGLHIFGAISPHLGNLTFLQFLHMSSNNFTGSIPSEFSNLRRLKEINLASNQLTGSIPNGLLNISSLVELVLDNNQLSGEVPNDICSNTAPKLKTMYMTGNQLSGKIPAELSKCRDLENLDLSVNHFTGNIPTEIASLPMLSFLYLDSNNFTGNIPSSIFNISSLIVMKLGDNNLVGSIPNDNFYNLPYIEELYLYSNHLTGGIPKQIGNLTSLTWLDLSLNNLSGDLPQELGHLSKLNVLEASFNALSGSIPSSIFNISTLKEISLQQNLFSGSLPSTMGLDLPNLQELYIFYNRLSGEIPSSITNASQLTHLELNRNSLSGSIPDFSNLQQLQVLRLWENKLTGANSATQELGFLTSLTSCRYLKNLEVSDNPLNGILPTSIGNLSTSLVTFYASTCNIGGGIPSEIGNLKSLLALRLAENQLAGFIPTTMGELNQLGELKLGSNRLQGYIPDSLCQMRHLGLFNLSLNMLSGPINECLGELTSLRTVSFASNKLNSTIPSKFWDLRDLVILDLSSNDLNGQISPQIGTWKINQLDLSHNQFTGDIPSSIGGCQSLEQLSLANNKFTGSIPESLKNVRVLSMLDLSSNNLSGSIPDSLKDLQVLQSFNVSYNKLVGKIPEGGCFDNFSAQSFIHNSGLCGKTRFQVPPCPSHGGSRQQLLKYIVPSIISVVTLVVVVLVVIWRCKPKNIPPPTEIPMKTDWERISYLELVRGTSSFSEINLLGRGGFGSVFKATIRDGINVAVKVFNLQLEGATKSFETESEILSSIRHRNLVPIIGCCSNNEFKALILEYMPNGSLEKWLHFDSYRLDLKQRLNIATDVALALEYLHHGHTFPVVHCDIKPSNVLLDKDMAAHVGDFGISKLFDQGETMIQTTTLATIGYAAPEYGTEGKVSINGDVYSYGILLLEMFTRKKPTDDMFSAEMSLKDWVSEAVEENIASEVVDPDLLSVRNEHFSAKQQCVSSIFDLAMKCLAFSPDERINMQQVVADLGKIECKVAATTKLNNNRH